MYSKLKSQIKKHPRILKIARKVKAEAFYIFANIREYVLKQRNELTPPMKMRALAGRSEDFRDVGESYLQCLIDLGGLKPNQKVLDVGCGVGRVAGPLTNYLSKKGKYEGLDIISKAIEWDKKTFEPRFPNFHFQLADVYNKAYNPKGTFKASNYRFPFENESFDFVFLTSVFTHMLKNDMENYFSEIGRVLKPKGRCLISFFILNKHSIELIETKKSVFNFQYKINGYRTIDAEVPEEAVAYDEKTVRQLFAKNKLSIIEPIHFGYWSQGKPNPSLSTLQDLIIAIKQDA